MSGFDLELVPQRCPTGATAGRSNGGAGQRSDLPLPVQLAGASAVACRQHLCLQGRQKGVLINYPSRLQLDQLFASHDCSQRGLPSLSRWRMTRP